MTKLLLILHVIAAILAVGPVAVAASVFPRELRDAATRPDDVAPRATLATLHRICRVYAGLALLVPTLGFATAGAMGVLGDPWLTTSILLTALAGGLLGGIVLPWQRRLMNELDGGRQLVPGRPIALADVREQTVRLAMVTGVFNLMWATVTALMILRPGSTTGA